MKATLYCRKGYEFLLLLFFASFFPMLGSDPPGHVALRMAFGAGVGALFFLVPVEKRPEGLKSFSTVFLLAFLGFETVRAFWLGVPFKWFFYAGVFLLAQFFFTDRARVIRLSWVAAAAGFFLALNAIPALLLRKGPGYVGPDGVIGFFYPVFYFHEWVPKYLLNRYAQPNYTGDVIAFGFFPALGLFVYFARLLLDRHRRPSAGVRPSIPSLALLGTFASVTALAAILIFSRGTILSLIFAFSFFLLAHIVKFPSKSQWLAAFAGVLVIGSMLIWTGNLPDVWKELQTLKRETGEEYSSGGANREGAKRAMAIFRAHPVWGVGTGGYASVSLSFATPGTEKHYELIQFESMCHYLHVLAEEGAGAFLYYLFILAYCLEIVVGLFRTQSRFQFTIGLAFASAVLMVLVHASINHLMQRFAVSVPVYLYMGAGLAIVNAHFDRTETRHCPTGAIPIL